MVHWCLCLSWGVSGEVEQEEPAPAGVQSWWRCSSVGQKGELHLIRGTLIKQLFINWNQCCNKSLTSFWSRSPAQRWSMWRLTCPKSTAWTGTRTTSSSWPRPARTTLWGWGHADTQTCLTLFGTRVDALNVCLCSVLGLPPAKEVPEHPVLSGSGVESPVHGEDRQHVKVSGHCYICVVWVFSRV